MRLTLTTLWADARFLAVLKPAGVSVFPRRDGSTTDCVLARLLAARPEQGAPDWPRGFAGGIAHRLDVSTSGQLLVARTPEGLAVLRAAFPARRLRKRYRFITARAVPWRTHRVAARIAGDPRRKSRVVVERGGSTPHRGRWREAQTRLTYVRALAGGLHDWAATMRTGARHQIRVHAAFAGIALCGDRRYGGGPGPACRPDGVEFLLHHVGLEGRGLLPSPAPLPDWWPADAR